MLKLSYIIKIEDKWLFDNEKTAGVLDKIRKVLRDPATGNYLNKKLVPIINGPVGQIARDTAQPMLNTIQIAKNVIRDPLREFSEIGSGIKRQYDAGAKSMLDPIRVYNNLIAPTTDFLSPALLPMNLEKSVINNGLIGLTNATAKGAIRAAGKKSMPEIIGKSMRKDLSKGLLYEARAAKGRISPEELMKHKEIANIFKKPQGNILPGTTSKEELFKKFNEDFQKRDWIDEIFKKSFGF